MTYWDEHPTLYRPWLDRDWSGLSAFSKRATFIMLNPSTADETRDDPTIRRCISFAKREGCDGLIVVNLYALRTTRPAHLFEHPDPVGRNLAHECPGFDSNDDAISGAMAMERGPVIAAWGGNAERGRVGEVEGIALELGRQLWCLGTTKDGSPRHPLYVRNDQPLMPWPVTL